MRIATIIKIFLIFVCIAFYSYSAVITNTGQVCSISIDIGKPLSIVWPVEVAIVGDNGEKGLRIGPKVGRGWRGEAGGQASYSFYVTQDGKYYIWAYGLWYDECANAVFASIDDSDKAIIGNDPIYNQWHWVRGFDIRLGKGTHTLVLSNHSDHISMQKIFLTNSISITPEDCNNVFSDIFYDGFDGCDQGNFDNWEVRSGEWLVQNPIQQMCLEENALIGKSEDSSFIIYKGNDWSDYSLNISVRPIVSESTQGTFSICFGVKDNNEYHELLCQVSEDSDICKMQIRKNNDKRTETFGDFEVPWKKEQWHLIDISLDSNCVKVKADDNKPVEALVDYKIIGGIGMRLEGKITTYFDDIHIRQNTEIKK